MSGDSAAEPKQSFYSNLSSNTFTQSMQTEAVKQVSSLLQKAQKMQFSAMFGKLLPLLFTMYGAYLCFTLWYNWLLFPLFTLVPFVTYKYLGGLMFMNIFGYFPAFFNNLFATYNLDETDVCVWYDICCENWKNGGYIEVIKLLIETHNNILTSSLDHNRNPPFQRKNDPAKTGEKTSEKKGEKTD